MATATNNKPTYSTKHGCLDVAVWKNTSGQDTYYKVSLTRSFKEGEAWKSTKASFRRDDTLVAANFLKWAHDVVQDTYDTQQEDQPFASKTNRTLDANADVLEVEVSQEVHDQQLRYSVDLKRSYNQRGNWKTTVVSLASEECLSAARLLERAFDAIDSHVAAISSTFAETAKQQPKAEATATDEEIPF